MIKKEKNNSWKNKSWHLEYYALKKKKRFNLQVYEN